MQIAEFAGGCQQLQGKHDYTQHSTWSTSFSGPSSAENRYQNLLTHICGTQKYCDALQPRILTDTIFKNRTIECYDGMFPTKECFLLSIEDAMIRKERYAITMHQVYSSQHRINCIKHGTFSFEKECERVH